MPANPVAKDRPFWISKIFLSILILKIASSLLPPSVYMKDLFTPFLNWFVISGFQNPWEFFFRLHENRMFPYPTAMLWIMSIPRFIASPFLSHAWQNGSHLHWLVMRIPLLAFDVLLLVLLLRLFPTQQKKVLAIYWCSPIVFFINYLHGQLDIVPTALFFASVYLLIQQQYFYSILLLAVSAATKTHIFIALPFIFTFLYRKRVSFKHLVGYFALFSATYLVMILPYALSPAFRQMVFNSPEQKKLFDFVVPVSSNLHLVVCPIAVAMIFMKFASYKKLNREILLMFLGITFAALVVLVPPMPGWFMWSLPFLMYFYMNNKDYSRAPFVLYNIIYVIYFLFFFEKDTVFQRITPTLPVKDLALSVLSSSVAFIAFWMFNLGIKKNEELKTAEAPLLIGIGGDSACGKHTLLRVLRNVVGKSRSIPIFGDDFHKWERGDENWRVFTHLNPSANKLHHSADLAVALSDGNSIEMVHYDHTSGKFSRPSHIEPNKFIFFVGLHPFYLKRMREMIPIKIFLDTDETLRQYWKTQRDMAKRGYQRSQILEQIQSRQQDRVLYIEPQKNFADLTIQYLPAGPLDPDAPAFRKIPLKTVYRTENSINLETLVAELRKVSTLQIEHASTIQAQELQIIGTISARQIMHIAYLLGLNFDELLINTRGWLKNHNGITQLIFLLLYNHKMKVHERA